MVFTSPKNGILKVGSIIYVHIAALYRRLINIPHQANRTLGALMQTTLRIGFISRFDLQRTSLVSRIVGFTISRQLFANILRLIAEWRAPTDPVLP